MTSKQPEASPVITLLSIKRVCIFRVHEEERCWLLQQQNNVQHRDTLLALLSPVLLIQIVVLHLYHTHTHTHTAGACGSLQAGRKVVRSSESSVARLDELMSPGEPEPRTLTCSLHFHLDDHMMLTANGCFIKLAQPGGLQHAGGAGSV